MHAHNGFWAYVLEHGPKQSKAFVENRATIGGAADSRWLVGRAGVNARKNWEALGDNRLKYLRAHPDPSFPADETNGISDGRKAKSALSAARAKTKATTTTPDDAGRSLAMELKKTCTKARKQYYEAIWELALINVAVVCKDGVHEPIFKVLGQCFRVAAAKVALRLPSEYREEVERAFIDALQSVDGQKTSIIINSKEELDEQEQKALDKANRARMYYEIKAKTAMKVSRSAPVPPIKQIRSASSNIW